MVKPGLTDKEVIQSRKKYGSNSLTEVKSETFLQKLIGNFGDPMIKILCVALIINAVLAVLGQADWIETIGIAVAVVLATFVSTFSEYRNENSFQKLQAEASRILCKVYRNGKVIEIPIEDIVVGDVVVLQTGDKIPADGIMIDGKIAVDQAALNGESEEATKLEISEDYQDDSSDMDFLNKHKVFMGTIVCSGNGLMEVSVVGDKSVYGKLANELQQEDDRESPLKVKLGKLADSISKFGYIGGVAIAIAFLFLKIVVNNSFDMGLIIAHCSNIPLLIQNLVDAVILAIIIIVMAVPEGLPLMIALVSAQNMGKMLKDNVLVREINGIETAGSLNILFTDKTGTLTKGQLEVVNFIAGSCESYNSFEKIPDKLSKILALSIVENTTAFVSREGGEFKCIGGNGTDRAVLGFVPVDKETANVEKIETIPFSSDKKYSAVQVTGDYNYTLIKGASERIVAKCKWYFDQNGEKKPLESLENIENVSNLMAERAIRVLGVAVSEKPIVDGEIPKDDYILVGILGIRDEVRQESVTAIQEVHDAGVQVVMITGDRKDTAIAIAKETGLLKTDDDIVITSMELNEISDEELKSIIPRLRVVARALPSDKSRLVRVAQEINLVVGMTGDGVNDSPALKKADVGFGMGSGTEVAKEASDIVILDDNFSSIDKAILYGRTIFNSIRKFVIFQLTINVSAVLISFVCPLLGMDTPLSITQFLWVNLVMDTLAALAFGGEPALKRYMKEKPKRRDESIISKYMWSEILIGSLWMFILSMITLRTSWASNFFVNNPMSLLTAYFCLFIFTAVFNAFNARTEEINLFDNIGKNKNFLIVLGIIAIIQVIMAYVGGDLLRGYGLSGSQWLYVLVLAITIIPVDIIRKLIYKAMNKQENK